MGQEIEDGRFREEDRENFRARLRRETASLKSWFEDRTFEVDPGFSIGLELEAWLVDENHLPSPRNHEFFSVTDDPDIVAELSKFNFEINAPVHRLKWDVFSQTQAELQSTWRKCERAGEMLKLHPVTIGILPTVRDEMLQPNWMSESPRYRALNRELSRQRGDAKLHIQIEGYERLDYQCDHLMLEAACTSLQAHLKVNQDDAVRFYNAAVLAAAPLVAATANSPFLYGKSLWEETRIAAFEQATALNGFRDSSGQHVQRVTLGTGFVRHSLFELFLENLSYPVLLPALQADDSRLPHLRMQNGTIWRWVRPILGFDEANTPHLRLEHRVMPAGPSLIDTAANLALCHGLVLALGRADIPPETETTFLSARDNFYRCAQQGLKADIQWGLKKLSVQALLVEHLLPAARRALALEGVAESDLKLFFDDCLVPRMNNGMTGAQWQRSFLDCNGRNFQALTERYVALQATGAPVHTWTT